MKQHSFFVVLCALLLLGGCASQPGRVGAIGAGGPEIMLPGGDLDHARLLAMGMARSKGWTVSQSGERRLILERNLPSNAPQASLLSADAMLTTPKLQVETDLEERRDGILVALRSFIIVNPGTEKERRVDYTDDYQSELLISLNALASAWLENRERIASEIPLPPDPDAIQETAEVDPNSAASGDMIAAADPGDAVGTSSLVDTSLDQTGSTSGATAGATPAVGVSPATTVGTSQAPTSVGGAVVAEDNAMLVLDGQARRGLWAFYAEASARERGCAVNERGAVLLNTSSEFELHEVQCNGGPNLLLRCQGGVCREVN